MTTPSPADVRRWLIEIPDLCALLPDALSTRVTTGHTSRPVPTSRPPINIDVADLLDLREKPFGRGSEYTWQTATMAWCDPDRMGVLPYLDAWCRDLEAAALDGDPIFGIEPHDVQPTPDEPTVAGSCAWLAGVVDWAATLPQWPEFADGVRVTHRRVIGATHHVATKREHPVPCRRCGDPLRRDGQTSTWRCIQGHVVAVQAVTLRQAAHIIGMSERTLRDWASKDADLTPVLADSGTRRLYDLGDIRRLIATKTLQRAIEHHTATPC